MSIVGGTRADGPAYSNYGSLHRLSALTKTAATDAN